MQLNQLKKTAKDFLLNEDGRTTKKNFIKLGILALAVASSIKLVEGNSHCNNQGHCNVPDYCYNAQHKEGYNGIVTAPNPNHMNSQLPGKHGDCVSTDSCNVLFRCGAWHDDSTCHDNNHICNPQHCNLLEHLNNMALSKIDNNIKATHSHALNQYSGSINEHNLCNDMHSNA